MATATAKNKCVKGFPHTWEKIKESAYNYMFRCPHCKGHRWTAKR